MDGGDYETHSTKQSMQIINWTNYARFHIKNQVINHNRQHYYLNVHQYNNTVDK